MLRKTIIIGVAVYVVSMFLGLFVYRNVYLAQSLEGTGDYLASVFSAFKNLWWR